MQSVIFQICIMEIYIVKANIRLRADGDIECAIVDIRFPRGSTFMFLFCFTVPVAHIFLSEEGCMGLWPSSSAHGEWQVNPFVVLDLKKNLKRPARLWAMTTLKME